MTLTLAIVGRPNVGKSTLFNRLVGRRLALVDDRPGVTRDRREGAAKLGDLRFRVIDTAGLEQSERDSLTGRMRAQTEAAIEQADAILFLIDARVGVSPDDAHFANLARRAGKPVIVVANKAEGKAGLAGAYEAFDLGLGDPLALSAEHGEGLGELYDAIRALAPDAVGEGDDEAPASPLELGDEEDGSELDPTKPLGIVVAGRPNAGKSTLINRILGEERLLTGPEPGVTRDSIGVDFEWRSRDGAHVRAMKLFDTAGLRKKARIEEKLEKLAAHDAVRAVKFAEIVILLLDAAIPFEKQDLSLADLVAREGRGLVIGLNKWDLVDEPSRRLTELREDADRLLPQVRGVPVIPLSGLTGAGLDKLLAAAVRAHEVWNKRVSTGRLNRWLESVLEHAPPPAVAGRRIKIRYMTQPKARPPSFVIFGNQLDHLPTSYERYLINGLRTTFELPGVPIRITKKSGRNPFADKGKKRGS